MENTKNKNGRRFRLCLILLSLALLTFGLAMGTMARYSTSGGSGKQSARVAKFGVTITATDDSSFHTEYTTTDGNTITVKSSTGDKIVAPGTNDGGISFTVKGSPEVKTRISVGMTVEDDIFYTYSSTKEPYRPVIFTLTKGGAVIASGSLTDIESAIDSHTYDYDANEAIDTTYTLSWSWPYHVDNESDYHDTILGDIAAGIRPDIDKDAYSLKVGYSFSISIYQIAE